MTEIDKLRIELKEQQQLLYNDTLNTQEVMVINSKCANLRKKIRQLKNRRQYLKECLS